MRHQPRGLSEIFENKLRRIRSKRGAEQLLKMLKFCGGARRPLTLAEYQELLSLSPHESSLEQSKFPNNMYQLIGDCCGLLFTDEEEGTVHYVHNSVQEHLFNTDELHVAAFDMDAVDDLLGLLCMTYLDLPYFKHKIAKLREGSDTRMRPLQLGTLPIYQSSSTSNRLAKKLLSRYSELQHLSSRDIEKRTQDLLGSSASSFWGTQLRESGFEFLPYAEVFWWMHVSRPSIVNDDMVWSLFRRCVKESEIPAQRPWDPEDAITEDNRQASHTPSVPKPVIWLSINGHYPLFHYITECKQSMLTDFGMRYVMTNLSTDNRFCFTRRMLEFGEFSMKTRSFGLFHSARTGCHVSVQMFLQAATDVDTTMASDLSALQIAAGEGHLEVVKRLAEAGASINGRGRASSPTPLHLAAQRGHIKVMEALICLNADVNALASGHTTLQFAAKNGHLVAVRALINAGAKVNERYSGHTPLQEAAQGGHLDIVEALIGANANINAVAFEQTALQLALKEGHLGVVERLIAAGAKLKMTPYFPHDSVIEEAIRQGHVEAAKALIAANADINALPPG